jgi:hypothetical protein
MKRGKRKALVLASQGVGALPVEVQRIEHFARTRGKHCRAYMQLIARKGAKVTNDKRAALRAV